MDTSAERSERLLSVGCSADRSSAVQSASGGKISRSSSVTGLRIPVLGPQFCRVGGASVEPDWQPTGISRAMGLTHILVSTCELSLKDVHTHSRHDNWCEVVYQVSYGELHAVRPTQAYTRAHTHHSPLTSTGARQRNERRMGRALHRIHLFCNACRTKHDTTLLQLLPIKDIAPTPILPTDSSCCAMAFTFACGARGRGERRGRAARKVNNTTLLYSSSSEHQNYLDYAVPTCLLLFDWRHTHRQSVLTIPRGGADPTSRSSSSLLPPAPTIFAAMMCYRSLPAMLLYCLPNKTEGRSPFYELPRTSGPVHLSLRCAVWLSGVRKGRRYR